MAYDSQRQKLVVHAGMHDPFMMLADLWEWDSAGWKQCKPAVVPINLNPHLHVLVLDGVYARLTPLGPLFFHRLPDPTDAEIGKLLASLRKRLTRRLRRVGILPPGDEEAGDEPPLPFESESVAATYAAAVLGSSMGSSAPAAARGGRSLR